MRQASEVSSSPVPLQFWLRSSSCSCPLTNSETSFRFTCPDSNSPGQTRLGQWRIYSIRYIPPSWPILCLFPRSALFPRSLLASERRLLAEVHAAQRARAFQLSAFNPVCQLVLMLQREIWGRKAAWNIYKKKTHPKNSSGKGHRASSRLASGLLVVELMGGGYSRLRLIVCVYSCMCVRRSLSLPSRW